MAKPFRMFGGTVDSALTHAVTDYDRKQMERATRTRSHFNHYALAHYLRAVENIRLDIAAGATARAAVLAATHGALCAALLRAIGEPKATPDEIARQNYRAFYVPAVRVLPVDEESEI